ncbi:MAG: hypothetical protein QM752_05150 [Gammaproteobacteria bacterium]
MRILGKGCLLSLLVLSPAWAQDAPDAPITLILQNDSDLDVEPAVVSFRNISAQDIRSLSRRVLYAHQQTTVTLDRTGYPARLFIVFRIPLTQAPGIVSVGTQPEVTTVPIPAVAPALRYAPGIPAPILPSNYSPASVVVYPVTTPGAGYPAVIPPWPGSAPVNTPVYPNYPYTNYPGYVNTVPQAAVVAPTSSPNYNPSVLPGGDIVVKPNLVAPYYGNSAIPLRNEQLDAFCESQVPAVGDEMMNTLTGELSPPLPVNDANEKHGIIRAANICQFPVARWEYTETNDASVGCNLAISVSPYTLECSSNNDLAQPVINLNVGHETRPLAPTPLLYGGEIGVGPPTTP